MVFDTSIGIKQVIRYEWMNYTVNLFKSGLSSEDIRKELEAHLSAKKGSGGTGERAKNTLSFIVSMLMNIWITPNTRLRIFRDKLFELVNIKDFELVSHWMMLASTYLFWFNLSFVFGSLFKLQNQIVKNQVLTRTYEVLGERNTVKRCSEYVIRSFVSWDIIKDKEKAGYYEMGLSIPISDITLTSFLIETMLYAIPEKRIALNSILNYPSYFTFQLPAITGSQLSKVNTNLSVEQFSINEEYISLNRLHHDHAL
jgi:hypothetical protein